MTVRAGLGGVGLGEYRLEELAQLSGVTARNIRAYRERGLLDPPRRVGRSAYYDEAHLAQLKVITQLLGKGFSSAHIAEFFDCVRHGQDLVDVLGIDRAKLAAHTAQLDVDLADTDARTLVEAGLAEVVDGSLVLTDPALSESVADGVDQRLLIQTAARIARLTADAVDDLAEQAAGVFTGGTPTHAPAESAPAPADTRPGEAPADIAAITPAVVSRAFSRSFHRAFRRALRQ
jgi:DNA-binding transcriptional MerR regulator